MPKPVNRSPTGAAPPSASPTVTPGAPQFYPTKGVRRSAEAEWKGLLANALCVLIGVMFVLCIQSLMGSFSWQKPYNKGWPLHNVVLRHFDYRGTAEMVRLILEDTETAYTEEKFSAEQWAAIQNDTIRFPFGTLPQLEVDGSPVVHPPAIMKYIGKAMVTLGPMDVQEEVFADIVVGGWVEFRADYEDLVYNPAFNDELKASYVDSTLATRLHQFESILSRGGKKSFLPGRLTYLDYMVFDLIDVHLRLDKECLTDFPLLAAWYKKIATTKNLKKYLKSKKRPKKVNGPTAKFDN